MIFKTICAGTILQLAAAGFAVADPALAANPTAQNGIVSKADGVFVAEVVGPKDMPTGTFLTDNPAPFPSYIGALVKISEVYRGNFKPQDIVHFMVDIGVWEKVKSGDRYIFMVSKTNRANPEELYAQRVMPFTADNSAKIKKQISN